MSVIENYIAFYPPRAFWVDQVPELQNPVVFERFYDYLSEILFSHGDNLFTIEISRDSMIHLRIHSIEDEIHKLDDNIDSAILLWVKYLKYVNTFLFLLEVSIQEEMNLAYTQAELTREDMFRGRAQSLAFSSLFSVGRYYFEKRLLTSKAFAQILDPVNVALQFWGRYAISNQILEKTSQKFAVTISDILFVELLAKLYKGVCQYRLGDYSMALILAWFIIEAIIDNKWKKLLDEKNNEHIENKKRIDKDRRRTLTGRDYPVSVILNMLEIQNILSYFLFERLDEMVER